MSATLDLRSSHLTWRVACQRLSLAIDVLAKVSDRKGSALLLAPAIMPNISAPCRVSLGLLFRLVLLSLVDWLTGWHAGWLIDELVDELNAVL